MKEAPKETIEDLEIVTAVLKDLLHGRASRGRNGDRLNSIAVTRGTLTALYTRLAVCTAELQKGHTLIARGE